MNVIRTMIKVLTYQIFPENISEIISQRLFSLHTLVNTSLVNAFIQTLPWQLFHIY